ncbi:MAG: hypothetical protein GW903_02885 [Alphaproteobacteria bacterium]|nr:hypothetical protein [Alphaproteobacteria bacterium]NCQ87919.1 hypothetical protein [Alphaproteobacteria bacterium]NCT05574.1 hypothetical protein [Alphaproteobacteria bacterium]
MHNGEKKRRRAIVSFLIFIFGLIFLCAFLGISGFLNFHQGVSNEDAIVIWNTRDFALLIHAVMISCFAITFGLAGYIQKTLKKENTSKFWIIGLLMPFLIGYSCYFLLVRTYPNYIADKHSYVLCDAKWDGSLRVGSNTELMFKKNCKDNEKK